MDAKSKVHVAISSDVEKERAKDITIEQAASTLRVAEGWRSTVMVSIVAHDIPLHYYLPLLKAVSENPILALTFVEGTKPNLVNNHVKKRFEEQPEKPTKLPKLK